MIFIYSENHPEGAVTGAATDVYSSCFSANLTYRHSMTKLLCSVNEPSILMLVADNDNDGNCTKWIWCHWQSTKWIGPLSWLKLWIYFGFKIAIVGILQVHTTTAQQKIAYLYSVFDTSMRNWSYMLYFILVALEVILKMQNFLIWIESLYKTCSWDCGVENSIRMCAAR